MSPYIVGIDIGTGSIKAVAITSDGTIVAKHQHHYPFFSSKPDYNEQEPETIWQAFIKIVREVVKATGSNPAAVCLSSVMHSVIMVDKNGKELSNMITWADRRNADDAEDLYHSQAAPSLYEATGTPIHAMSPLTKIMWLKRCSTLFEKTFKFISIKEYIWFKLFEEFQIDYSLASATGLFNIHELQWHEPALKLAGISSAQLSNIVNTDYSRKDVKASIASLLTINTDTTFIIGSSDGCMASLGSFSMEEGIGALTIGTSGALRIKTTKPINNFNTMVFNYRFDEETFISGGPINNGGNVLQWLLKSFLFKDHIDNKNYNELFKSIERVPPGCNGLMCLPYITGERAPIWDAKSCGTFFGIKDHHTQPYFIKAAIEGTCYTLSQILHQLEEGATIRQLNASGGFMHSKEWIQILADITDKPISLIQQEDASAVGAAYFALKELGLIDSYEQMKPGSGTIIQPKSKEAKIYKQQYRIYGKLYDSLKDQMHELHKLYQEGFAINEQSV
jgi:gluconokinase